MTRAGVDTMRAKVLAQGFMTGRYSIFMNGHFWRVMQYSTSGDVVLVYLVRKEDIRKRSGRREMFLNTAEFLVICDRHFYLDRA